MASQASCRNDGGGFCGMTFTPYFSIRSSISSTSPSKPGHSVRFVKKAVRGGGGGKFESRRRENRAVEGAEGEGLGKGCYPSHRERSYFKIVYCGAFSIIILEVLFVIKCRERYVITVFLATDSDTDSRASSFHQSRKLILIQSVSSNSRRFHSYSMHVLCLKSFYMSCKRKLHCTATSSQGFRHKRNKIQLKASQCFSLLALSCFHNNFMFGCLYVSQLLREIKNDTLCNQKIKESVF